MTRYIGSWQTPSIKLPESTDTSAPGIWKLDEQFMLQKWGRWPTNNEEDWLTLKIDTSKEITNNLINIAYHDSLETNFEFRVGYSGNFLVKPLGSWITKDDISPSTGVVIIQIKSPINTKIGIGGSSLIEMLSFGDTNHFSRIRFIGGDSEIPTIPSINLEKVPNQLPPYITDCSFMFLGCINLAYGIDTWDTSNVINMHSMFNMGDVLGASSTFNIDISDWDTSNVEIMTYMFNNSRAFNRDISRWDVSNVINMDYMFNDAILFNQDLSSWCVSQFIVPPSWFDYGATNWILPRPNWGAPCI